MLVYNLLQYLLIGVLGLATAYIFLFALAGLFYFQAGYPQTQNYRRIAVLIPGYKEDAVILEVAKSALEQQYPTSLFDVVVIADSFQPETIEALRKLPLRLIEVRFDKSTKSRALNKAMEQLELHYEIAVVLDADNIMAPDFLTKINATFEQDVVAIQGHRKAKNLNNSWAVLDAVSEEINNHIFRKGHRVLGLSSAIIGSGMAFRYHYFKKMMASVHAVGGFDKEIELKMLKEGKKIAYLDDAIVLDEKVQQSDVFSNQRRRWLAAQIHYFRQGFPDAVKHLITRGNADYFDKAIQFIQPPRILLLGSVMVLGMGCIAVNMLLEAGSGLTIAWIILMAACVLALLLSIPRSLYNRKTFMAVMGLPRGMLLMLRSLLKTKGANKTFIHTKHTATTGTH